MDKYRKLCSDTVVFSLGSFGSKILVFLLMPLYTALLSPEEYGVAELIFSTANLLMPFACVGMTNGIFRFIADRSATKEEKREIFSCGIFLLCIGFSSLFAVGLPIFFLKNKKSEILLVLLYILTADLQAIFAQYLRAQDKSRLFAFQGVLNTLLTVGLNLTFLTVFHLGVTGYVLSVILANFITAVFLFFRERLYRSFSVHLVTKKRVAELIWFSLPLIPTSVCWLITALSDRFLVTYFCGTAINGLYTAAYKIPGIVNLCASVFLQAWQFSAVSESADETECSRFYSKVFRYYLALIFSGTAILIFASPLLTKLLLNRAFWGAGEFMPILLIASAVEAIVAFLASVYLIKKKSLNSLFTALSGAILNIVLNWLLIPSLGGLGAAIATLAGYGLVYFLRLADVPRYLFFDLDKGRQAFSLLCILAEAAVMSRENSQQIFLCGFLAFAVCLLNLPVLIGAIKSFFIPEKIQE